MCSEGYFTCASLELVWLLCSFLSHRQHFLHGFLHCTAGMQLGWKCIRNWENRVDRNGKDLVWTLVLLCRTLPVEMGLKICAIKLAQ